MDKKRLVRALLAKDPAWEYGSILPIATRKGEVAAALPDILRTPMTSWVDLMDSMGSGQLSTREGTGEMLPDVLNTLAVPGAAGVAGVPKGALGMLGTKLEREALDMSPEARLARAREQGFDTENVVYHGTPNEFDEFDLARTGENTLTQGQSPAVFATTSPKLASDYASGWGTEVREGARVIPMYMNRSNVDVWDWGGGRLAGDEVKEAIRQAKKAKRDGVIFERAVDTIRDVAPGGVASLNAPTVVAALNPRMFRSVNAAFDPAKKGKKGLLLEGSGLGALVAALMGEDRR